MSNETWDTLDNTSTVNRIYWWYVVWASGLGILLNVYCVNVLIRLRRHNARFTLLVIAASDLLALFLIFGRTLLGVPVGSDHWATIFCKSHTFLLHCASSYSVWCWVLWSIVRYMAVFHPYEHRRFRKCNNSCGLLYLLVVCLSTESWILISVVSVKENARCTLNVEFMSETTFRYLNLVETLTTYAVPLICVIATSVAVLLRICIFGRDDDGFLPKNERGSVTRKTAVFRSESRQRRIKQRQFETLIKLVVLVVVSLALNFPNCLIRLLNTFDYDTGVAQPYKEVLEKTSYALSYTHYAVNCLYLRLAINVPKGRKRSTDPRSTDHRSTDPRSCSEETYSRIRTTT